jgi:DNA-binding transcriptional regulator YdaS (Cro superfamily)
MESGNPLAKAVERIGNLNALATKIGRSQSTVWRWMQRGWPAPDACPAIEAATGISTAELLKPAFKRRRKKKAAA